MKHPNKLYYIYPIHQKGAFNNIARQHIKYLRKYAQIEEIDFSILDSICWYTKKRVLVHPVMYPFAFVEVEDFPRRRRSYERLKKVAERMCGFDVADTDQISKTAVSVLNDFDLIIVPSNWCKKVFKNSGVETSVEVVPHGLPEEFLHDSDEITSQTVYDLKELKEKRNAVFILYFLIHSGFRKGADLVADVWKRIRDEYENVYLIVKQADIIDPYTGLLDSERTIFIREWMTFEQLRELYDVCDILLCPSRGGGFELNALEALARGLITIVPEAGSFLDIKKYCLTVEIEKWVPVFPDNPIHCGLGFQASVDDMYEKLKMALDNLESFKYDFRKQRKKIQKMFSYENVVRNLADILKKHNFLD